MQVIPQTVFSLRSGGVNDITVLEVDFDLLLMIFHLEDTGFLIITQQLQNAVKEKSFKIAF